MEDTMQEPLSTDKRPDLFAQPPESNRKDPTEGMNRHQRRKWEAEHRHEAGKARARKNKNGQP
jgi:hypothetical protein